ncbi:IclR family transcriptional regulator [Tersicoccus phoenicis]|uniref:IclR family transcriptional regulator n=1 Tax=Tersicoccus phoenicis TaxID=554083 RepID=A0A1R1L7Y4_9MICC|nr:IclR family transcriptional regulator [Tersicoccus phoenicis]OMH23648.1 IclR family transcriptional regulator [Tersicoccus phoenicis]
MQNSPLQTRPAYALTSVDNTLRLLQLLRDTGRLRLKDAAEELGIAPSTAHRLMAMLVYRGFAVQDEDRRYQPGPALGVGPVTSSRNRQLRSLCAPQMEALCADTGETVNLSVRVGTKSRFLFTVESSNVLRVGDRRGAVLPAHRTSGGKVLLAELDDDAVRRLFTSPGAETSGDALDEAGLEDLLRELAQIRQQGFAANIDATESGVSALGVALRSADGRAVASLSLSAPTFRYERLSARSVRAVLFDRRRQIEEELADLDTDD